MGPEGHLQIIINSRGTKRGSAPYSEQTAQSNSFLVVTGEIVRYTVKLALSLIALLLSNTSLVAQPRKNSTKITNCWQINHQK